MCKICKVLLSMGCLVCAIQANSKTEDENSFLGDLPRRGSPGRGAGRWTGEPVGHILVYRGFSGPRWMGSNLDPSARSSPLTLAHAITLEVSGCRSFAI